MYSPLQLKQDFHSVVFEDDKPLMQAYKYQRRKQKVRGVNFTPLEGTLRDTVEELKSFLMPERNKPEISRNRGNETNNWKSIIELWN
ncbi:hypothetical protein TorRG33x02_194090 [Trema orientale]|uniref:Uncharacterized protein n=1 Tax=Trema orientale TaxID=63057 RepID=A0A2P5EH31_TREOI|nr:hypothetical protein TorRG33x02_194090 [Trema orientale]